MQMKPTQIITSMIAATVMVSAGGCPGVWSDSGMPLIIREKVEFPVPADGSKYPLVTPTSEEEKGVLLRCKPEPRKHKYKTQMIFFTEVVGDEGYKQIQKSSEIVRFLPADDGTNLIRESEIKSGLTGGLRLRSLISPRGGCLKSLETKPTGFIGLTTRLFAGDQFSSFDNKTSDRFPEEAARIGQTWTQVTQQRGKQSIQESGILWQLLGFADVRGRRCAVLQGAETGISRAHAGPNLTSKIISRSKTILYFDYERGLDIECVKWDSREKTLVRSIPIPSEDEPNKADILHREEGGSKDVMFWLISLAE